MAGSGIIFLELSLTEFLVPCLGMFSGMGRLHCSALDDDENMKAVFSSDHAATLARVLLQRNEKYSRRRRQSECGQFDLTTSLRTLAIEAS